MQNKMINIIIEIVGTIGRFIAIMAMLCGCFLFWKLIIKHIIL